MKNKFFKDTKSGDFCIMEENKKFSYISTENKMKNKFFKIQNLEDFA